MRLVDHPELWTVVEPYLDHALDLDAQQAAAWLDDLQLTQPQIAALIRDLLAEKQRLDAAGFLATPLVKPR